MKMRDSLKDVVDKMFPQENPLLDDYHPSVQFAETTPELFLRDLGQLGNEDIAAKVFKTILVLDQEQVKADCKNAFNNHELYACHALTTIDIHELDPAILQRTLEHLIDHDYPRGVTRGIQFMLDLINYKLVDMLIKREEENDDYYVNLSGSQLSGINLSKRQLSNINFTRCQIRYTKLEATTLSGAILYDTNLKGSDLNRAVLAKTKILNSNFSEGNLQFSAIIDMVVKNSNFTKTDLRGTALTNCTFAQCILKESLLLDPRVDLDTETLTAFIKYLTDLNVSSTCIFFNITQCIDAPGEAQQSKSKKRYDSKTRLALWKTAVEHPCFQHTDTKAWESDITAKRHSYLFTHKSSKQKIESKIKKLEEIVSKSLRHL